MALLLFFLLILWHRYMNVYINCIHATASAFEHTAQLRLVLVLDSLLNKKSKKIELTLTCSVSRALSHRKLLFYSMWRTSFPWTGRWVHLTIAYRMVFMSMYSYVIFRSESLSTLHIHISQKEEGMQHKENRHLLAILDTTLDTVHMYDLRY